MNLGELSACLLSVGEITRGKSSVGEMTFGELSVCLLSIGKTTKGNVSYLNVVAKGLLANDVLT